jgi:NTP pyrophosphatase (non-canonical NTP hydrolase)
MSDQRLTLNSYQSQAVVTDRIKGKGKGLDLPILGLFGEAGSLLSEVKKKERDSLSYLGYEGSVIEEIGDVLWYLAVIADHVGIPLATIPFSSDRLQMSSSADDILIADLQPQHILPLNAPNAAFERTLLELAGSVGKLADASSQGLISSNPQLVTEHLGSILKILIASANEAGVTLEQAAISNLEKAADRWPSVKNYPKPFDEEFPEEERLPRELTIDVFEKKVNNDKTYVLQRCNGIFIGDRLTDNIMKPDDYRFHDAFHYAYVAILGWSPVIRALFRLKRKSETQIDEGQDGARATLIEEGAATYVFGQAKQLDFFNGQKEGDLGFTFLKSVRQFVRGYESEACPLWLWEEAILRGNEAFRYLREHRRGRLRVSLKDRSFNVEELPQ